MASAQTVSFSQERSKTDLFTVSNCHIVGQKDGLYVGVVGAFANGVRNITHVMEVITFNDNMEVRSSQKIAEARKLDFLQASMVGNDLHLLLQDPIGLKQRGIYTAHVTIGGAVEEPKYVARLESEKWANFFVDSRSSENGEFFVVRILWVKKDASATQILLFDKTMNLLWDKTYDYAIDEVMLDDYGMVYAANCYTDDQSVGHASVFVFDGLGNPNVYSFDFPDVSFCRSSLLRVKDGKVLIGGFASSQKGRKDNYADLFFGLLVNGTTGVIDKFDCKPIEADDIYGVSNLKYGKKIKRMDIYAQKLVSMGVEPTPEGVAVGYSNHWVVEVTQNGVPQYTEYNTAGSLVFFVDNGGNVRWHHGIPGRICQKDYGGAHTHPCFFADGEDVVLIQSESPKNSRTEVNRQAKPAIVGLLKPVKAMVCAYRMTPDGMVQKCAFDDPHRTWVMPAHYRLPDGRTMFLQCHFGMRSNTATYVK